ncbi:hypothetical protein PAXRUDRAFT_738686 [Paxillus rubicundulus Ve08.2h10]|uniref:Unplaced genomic scaffold scaffold_89, whole genome shotgun sequence n=1 Tax=Paxillus rubicundulus Ve08.2h10 TaxID=930991 RepID=A0A0D0DI82_9AGAM|nr:hypothetical protein PAXRUDRAFT_738686 [Paxillus rubicundulus Ve08.2h10]
MRWINLVAVRNFTCPKAATLWHNWPTCSQLPKICTVQFNERAVFRYCLSNFLSSSVVDSCMDLSGHASPISPSAN